MHAVNSWTRSAIVAVGLAFFLFAGPPCLAATVNFTWFCERGECFFDSSGSTSQNRAHSEWAFGDGTFASTGLTDVFHDYNIGYGDYYFTVTLYAYYYSDPNSPYVVTCQIFTYDAPVGGVTSTSGSCS